MTKLKPVLTEKSMAEAAEGKYTFWVPTRLTKRQIKRLVDMTLGVNTKRVRTINYKSRQKMNAWKRKKQVVPAKKKAVVMLSEKEKIDVFGEAGKKK